MLDLDEPINAALYVRSVSFKISGFKTKKANAIGHSVDTMCRKLINIKNRDFVPVIIYS